MQWSVETFSGPHLSDFRILFQDFPAPEWQFRTFLELKIETSNFRTFQYYSAHAGTLNT